MSKSFESSEQALIAAKQIIYDKELCLKPRSKDIIQKFAHKENQCKMSLQSRIDRVTQHNWLVLLVITATVVVVIYHWGVGVGVLVAILILVLVGLIRFNKSILANITYFIFVKQGLEKQKATALKLADDSEAADSARTAYAHEQAIIEQYICLLAEENVQILKEGIRQQINQDLFDALEKIDIQNVYSKSLLKIVSENPFLSLLALVLCKPMFSLLTLAELVTGIILEASSRDFLEEVSQAEKSVYLTNILRQYETNIVQIYVSGLFSNELLEYMTSDINKQTGLMDYDKDYERISKPILYIVSELWDQSTKGKYGFKVQSEILLKHDEKSMPVVVGWYKKDPIFGTYDEPVLPAEFQIAYPGPDGFLPSYWVCISTLIKYNPTRKTVREFVGFKQRQLLMRVNKIYDFVSKHEIEPYMDSLSNLQDYFQSLEDE
jgi:hypothetical protein